MILMSHVFHVAYIGWEMKNIELDLLNM